MYLRAARDGGRNRFGKIDKNSTSDRATIAPESLRTPILRPIYSVTIHSIIGHTRPGL